MKHKSFIGKDPKTISARLSYNKNSEIKKRRYSYKYRQYPSPFFIFNPSKQRRQKEDMRNGKVITDPGNDGQKRAAYIHHKSSQIAVKIKPVFL